MYTFKLLWVVIELFEVWKLSLWIFEGVKVIFVCLIFFFYLYDPSVETEKQRTLSVFCVTPICIYSHYILHFTALHKCCIFHKWKARLFTSKKIMAHSIAILVLLRWSGTQLAISLNIDYYSVFSAPLVLFLFLEFCLFNFK